MKARQLALNAALDIARNNQTRNPSNGLAPGISSESVLRDAKKIEEYLIEDDLRKFTEDDMTLFLDKALQAISMGRRITPGLYVKEFKKDYWQPTKED